MTKITAKSKFTIPSIKIDNKILNKLAIIVEEQSQSLYDYYKEQVLSERSKNEYYQKYPEKIEDNLDSVVYSHRYEPTFSLEGKTFSIKSEKTSEFIEKELPKDLERIEMSIGDRNSPKYIYIDLLIAGRWDSSKSDVTIEGFESTWVYGISERLKKILNDNLLTYHPLVEKTLLRYGLAVLIWISLSFALTIILSPIILPLLKEGTTWIVLFILLTLGGGWIGVFGIEEFIKWLFPYFELPFGSKQKIFRKYVIGFLISSGLLTEIIRMIFS